MLKLKDWREVVFRDGPTVEITEKTRQTMSRTAQSGRYLINNMRIATNRVYTNSKYESWRAKILATPLP